MTQRLGEIAVRLHRGEEAQGMVEYALIIAFVGLAATAGMSALAQALNSGFSVAGSLINTYI